MVMNVEFDTVIWRLGHFAQQPEKNKSSRKKKNVQVIKKKIGRRSLIKAVIGKLACLSTGLIFTDVPYALIVNKYCQNTNDKIEAITLSPCSQLKQ